MHTLPHMGGETFFGAAFRKAVTPCAKKRSGHWCEVSAGSERRMLVDFGLAISSNLTEHCYAADAGPRLKWSGRTM